MDIKDNDHLLKHPGWLRYTKLIRKFDLLVVLLSLCIFALSIHFVKGIKVKS